MKSHRKDKTITVVREKSNPSIEYKQNRGNGRIVYVEALNTGIKRAIRTPIFWKEWEKVEENRLLNGTKM